MEGALHSWRIQRIENNSPNLDSYGKPLPPPPKGFYWEQMADKSWELRKFEFPDKSDLNAIEFKAPIVVEHVVLDSDTLQGLCLRYRVSAVTLRQYNNFSGDNFRYKKYLRIPIEPGLPIITQPHSEEVTLQRFRNETNESEAEAKCYLEEAGWDLEKALSSWKTDEAWEGSHLPLAECHSICVPPAAVVVPVPAVILERTSGYVPPRYTPLNIDTERGENIVEPSLVLE